MKKQMKWISAMALGATLCAFGGVLATQPAQASAVTTDANIAIVDGASLRVDGTFGLRFKTTIDAAYFTDDMEVHTLMARTEKLGAEELVIGATDVKDYTLDVAKKYQKGDDYYFNTVLTNIPDTQYGTEISVRAYVKSGDEIIYSETTTSKSVEIVANNALDYNFDAYKNDVAKYVVKGVAMKESMSLGVNKSLNVNATAVYADSLSQAVLENLANTYTLSYESSEPTVATVEANGKVTAKSTGNTVITASVNGLEDVFSQCQVTVVEGTVKYGEVFNFDSPDLSAVSVNDLSAGVLKEATLTTGTDSNGNYLQIDGKKANHIRFYGADSVDTLKSFDWFTIKFMGNYTNLYTGEPITDKTISVSVMNNSSSNASTTLNASAGTLVEYTVKRGDTNFEECLSDPFRFYVVNNTAYTNQSVYERHPLSLRIYSIEFGYGDIKADNGDNTTFNLPAEFGVASEEMKNVKFNGIDVANVAEFAPTENGTLTFTVVKDGFEETPFSVDVAYTSMLAWGEVLDFSNIDLTKVTVTNGTASIGTLGTSPALVVTTPDTWTAGATLITKIAMPEAKYQANFDYVEIYASGNQTGMTASFNGGWKSINNQTNNNLSKFTNSPLNYRTTTINNTTTSAISENNLQISYTISVVPTTLPFVQSISSIRFGFNDITSDGTQTFDLTSLFRATETELTNVSFDGENVANERAFVPTKSGVLTFTIKKDGYKASTFSVNVTVNN